TIDTLKKNYRNIINVIVIEILLILCFICPNTPKNNKEALSGYLWNCYRILMPRYESFVILCFSQIRK
ncbi:hypothetical protein, partial [Bacillus mycoides]|uniref:hypothetical protein n=1 Tax=Bacillus mycoides TaxID=1405 RepID=UPI003A80E72C